MKAPLYNKLCSYGKTVYPFHMPGHKFGKGGLLEQVPIHLLDATEASGLDNLYEAEGILKEAMELMASFYEAQETVFLTNGSTAGILASILSIGKPGDKILVGRNAHHSVWSALVLAGMKPIYIAPDILPDSEIIGRVTLETIKEALYKYPDVVGAILVSPTYEGIISPIKEIGEYLHRHHKVLIVDEAHGAHFSIAEEFPSGSGKEGADIVVQSMHKTLPTLGQSALLHLYSNRIQRDTIITNLKIIQTSSPSYAMMGIMDYMRGYIEENKAVIRENYIKPLLLVKEKLKKLKNLSLLTNDDISRLIIKTDHTNIDGYILGEILEKEYNIGVEACLENYIILISTFADTEARLIQLTNALLSIDNGLENRSEARLGAKSEASKNKEVDISYTYKVKAGLCPRDIHFGEKEWIPLEDASGRIASKNIMLYPPGIPILCIGEKIEENNITAIKRLNLKLLGIQKIEENIYIEVTTE